MNFRLFGLITCIFLATALGDCPDNYFYQAELNICLSYSSFVLRDWQSAHAWCDALSGGELLSIHNLITNSILINLQKTLSGDTLSWLGATRNDSQGQWTWSDGTQWDYQLFPSSSGAGNCGALNAVTQKWTYKDCESLLPFFCSVPPTWTTVAVETTTVANNSICSTTPKSLNCSAPEQQPLYNCQKGWQCFGEYEYLVIFDTDADQAEAVCSSQGGHLTSIHSDAENDFITNLCCPSDCRKFYHEDRCAQMITGGRVANGKFIWTDGTPFDYQGTICADYHQSNEYLQVMAFTGTNDVCAIPGNWLWLSITGDPYAVCKRKL